MTYRIAVAGKGGVGKTTLTGFMIEYLVEQNKGAILAVDADANSNLNEVLGEDVERSIGQVKEAVNHAELDGQPLPPGMTKADFLEMMINQSIVEGNGYDLLVMGRSQGEGCYCFVNGLLKTQIARLADNYEYLIIDNEAGMENMSRGTLGHVDLLILISDCSQRGIRTVARLRDLADELSLKIPNIGLIVNRAPRGAITEAVADEIEKYNLKLFGIVPQDDDVFEYDSYGQPLVTLPADAKAKKKAYEIFRELDI
ncbi:MAG: AAA family ATPase [Eubacteriaceae bacterium]|jgi:CO dehydrogenase maturation factor